MRYRSGREFSHPTEGTPALFVIESTSEDAEVFYEFTVRGSVGRATHLDTGYTSVREENDDIVVNDDGTMTVTGATGFGDGDVFAVQGEILSWQQTGGESSYNLYINDVDVTDDPTGPVYDIGRPAIPTPASDTCEDHIAAAQEWSTSVETWLGEPCNAVTVDLFCPFDDSVYRTQNACEAEALLEYGWVEVVDRPTVPTPAEETCTAHVAAAEDHAEAVALAPGHECSPGEVRMQCPFDPTVTHLARNGCEIEALESYGWDDMIQRPPIPVPAEDTCDAEVQAAQDYAAAVRDTPGHECANMSILMFCDETENAVEYTATNGCEMEALFEYGWLAEGTPGDGGDGGDGGGGARDAVLPLAILGAAGGLWYLTNQRG